MDASETYLRMIFSKLVQVGKIQEELKEFNKLKLSAILIKDIEPEYPNDNIFSITKIQEVLEEMGIMIKIVDSDESFEFTTKKSDIGFHVVGH